MSKTTQNGHSHAEAFCMMQYFGKGTNGSQIVLMIWNSRDGVTPFITYSKEYGIELQHVNWGMDKYVPDYKPKKGDLIWASHNEETAKIAAEKSYQYAIKQLEEVKGMTEDQRNTFGISIKMFEEHIADKQAYIDGTIEQLLRANGEPQPRLELVKEDWP